MRGDNKPRYSWTDDERRMHTFFLKVAGIVLSTIVGIVALIILIVRLAS